MRVQSPNSSFFPEIDFASKCMDLSTSNRVSQLGKQRPTSTIARLLYPISNANSVDIQRRIAGSRFYVGTMAGETTEDGAGHVAKSLEEGMARMIKGQKYS